MCILCDLEAVDDPAEPLCREVGDFIVGWVAPVLIGFGAVWLPGVMIFGRG